jgi:transposase
MTEGIIQKVIARYVKKGYDTDPQAWHIRKKVLPELQQEIITEIKKEFEQYPYYNYNARDNRTYVLRIPDIINKLIGDSK